MEVGKWLKGNGKRGRGSREPAGVFLSCWREGWLRVVIPRTPFGRNCGSSAVCRLSGRMNLWGGLDPDETTPVGTRQPTSVESKVFQLHYR